MKKVLFVATVVKTHINVFHIPYLKMLKEMGYETHVAARNDFENSENCVIPYCDCFHDMPFERNPLKINNIVTYKMLKKLILEEDYDIIHCHTPMGGVLTRLVYKKLNNKIHSKIIYTAHGFHFYKGAPLLNWMMYYPIEKYFSKYTDTLITINKEDYDFARRKFKKCNDIRFIPGVGIDENKFNFSLNSLEKRNIRESMGMKETDFVMIYPAELSKRKRQLWLISTISNLLKENRNMHLLLPGKDSLNGECQKLVKKMELEMQIHVLGHRNDIPKLLKISDLSLSSSNQEGLPVNIMEAMYVGLPIVATNCRGNRDLVINEKNGFLVEMDDNISFINSIKKVYNSKSRNNFEFYNKKEIKKYMLEDILKKIKEIYVEEKV